MLILVVCAASGKTDELVAVTPPPQAATVGYNTRTFACTFSARTVDLGNSQRPGFDWYPWHFFGQPSPASGSVVVNADGSVLIGALGLVSSLATAAGTRTDLHWTGVAFGGGAYFEATLKFDPANTAKGTSRAWPAFWSMSIEHLASLDGEQWPNQRPGYTHFIEPDVFEYDVWRFRPSHYYGGAVHESYGIYRTTCAPEDFCSVSNRNFTIAAPPDTDFKAYHKYGFLWVPATESTRGLAKYYFDGVATDDEVEWDLYTNQAPPPGRAPWTFGIIDQQHLVLIIGTGAKQPMEVESVSVWQSSSANNLRQ